MYSKARTTPSTDVCSADAGRLKAELAAADAVVIGAGAGLSTAAGFVYDGERFTKSFADFEAKYGFHDMYTGGFYPFATPEERWAYWSRSIYLNRYTDPPKPVYRELLALVGDKDYFVLTTNVDHCFQKAGFDKKRLFYTQGDYGLFQCSGPCRQETFDNESAVISMLEQQEEMRIPTALVPRCPHCGRALTMNLRSDDDFVQDEGWYRASKRCNDFLVAHRTGRVLYLELGVGYNTPGIIKYPFWQMTAENPEARLVSINAQNCGVPDKIEERSLCITSDIGEILARP